MNPGASINSIQAATGNPLFESGGGIQSIESRIRQIEAKIAAVSQMTKPPGSAGMLASPAGTQAPKAFEAYLQVNDSPSNNRTSNAASLPAPPTPPNFVPLQPMQSSRGHSPGNSGPTVPNFTTALPNTLAERKAALTPLVQQLSSQHGVDSQLVMAVIQQESGFNPQAVSHAGAQGLMQLMPQTAQWLGVQNPQNPEQNLDGGIRYLKSLLERFKGNVPLALAAYNAGPGAVDKHKGIPPYRETQQYVRNILGLYLKNRNA
ncbi:MAG: lytic transglycosylase domain-containing protein [Candidatus Melainabacteria bacterium]|nr:lytic transglycosylase domain-containing protein [Candidatus Melainabacteria bacterium]